MYYALAQNDNESWKVVFSFNYYDSERLNLLKESLDGNKNEILGMKVDSNLWDAAKIGAEFDGNSFSGGTENAAIPAQDDEFWNSVNSYAFLHNNKVIAGIITYKDTAQETFIEEAFSGKVRMFEVPASQSLQVGDIVTWDGEKFSAV